jgi:glucarate dehydratase
LKDDVIKNGKMNYKDGAIAVPKGPGLGVELDLEKLGKYEELYRKLGGYPYDRDPARPGWYARVPDPDYADHKKARSSRRR